MHVTANVFPLVLTYRKVEVAGYLASVRNLGSENVVDLRELLTAPKRRNQKRKVNTV